MFVLANEPQSIGKVLDSGIKLYVAGLKKILVLSFLMSLLMGIPSLLVDPGLADNPDTATDYLTQVFSYFAFFAPFALIFSSALLYRLMAVARQDEASMGVSIMVGLKKLIPMLLAIILYFVAAMLGTVLLIVPGIFLFIALSFYAPAIVIDDNGPIEALKTSYRLAKGNWWRIMIVWSVVSLIYFVIVVGIGLVFGFAIGFSMTDPEAFSGLGRATDFINIVLSTFVYPIFSAVMLALYFDLKLRKEGSDLESRMSETE